MRFLERLLLGIAILEIPLQIDTYLLYQEQEAKFGAVGGINVSVTTFCLVGLYILWFFDAVTLRRRELPRLTFSMPLLAYVGMVAFSLLVAQNELLAISHLALVTQALLLFLYVANRLQTKGDVQYVAVVLAGSLALQATIIIGTWFVAPRLIGNPLHLGPLSLTAWKDGRLCGTLATPVAAGSYLAMLLVPVGALLIAPVAARIKALALVAVTSGVLAVALTQSRGSVVAVGIAAMLFGGLLFLRGWLPKWSVALAVVIAAIVAVPLVHLFQNRIVEGDEGSAASRQHLARIAWEMIQDHPFVGVGAGNYHLASLPYENAAAFRSEWSYTVHCTYLLEWSEVGLLGLCAFLAFLLSIVYHGWRVWRLRDPFLAPLALALTTTVLGQMVHMLVDMFNSRSYVQIFWCCAAIVFAMRRIADAQSVRPIESGREVSLASPRSARVAERLEWSAPRVAKSEAAQDSMKCHV